MYLRIRLSFSSTELHKFNRILLVEITVLAQLRISKIIVEGSRPNNSTISLSLIIAILTFVFRINSVTLYFARIEMGIGRRGSICMKSAG